MRLNHDDAALTRAGQKNSVKAFAAYLISQPWAARIRAKLKRFLMSAPADLVSSVSHFACRSDFKRNAELMKDWFDTGVQSLAWPVAGKFRPFQQHHAQATSRSPDSGSGPRRTSSDDK